jgi:hypothetical protein
LDYEAANTSDTGGGGTAIDLTWDDSGAITGNLTAVLLDNDDNDSVGASDALDVSAGESIIVKLPKFTVPDEIDPDTVSVTGTGNAGRNPNDVSVSGTTLTLRMGNTGNDQTTFTGSDQPVTSIFIAKKAGIKNPAQANDAPGSYPITVENRDEYKAEGHAIVLRKVSAKPGKGTRGTMTTISGSGLPAGTTDVTINRHKTEVIVGADGSFKLEVDTAEKDNDGANVFSKDANTINVSDSRGKLANVTGTFTINPSFTIDPESPIPGQIVTITLTDITGDVTDASFAGDGIQKAFDTNDDGTLDEEVNKVTTDGKHTYQIKMPQRVRRGSVEMRVTVMGASAPLKKTVTIGTNALEVDPDTAVPGQQITITGSGFTAGGKIPAANIKIDSKVVTTDEESVDSTGNINITVNLAGITDAQKLIKSGTRNVEVTDSSGRVGTAKITVPKAEITLDPPEGLIGSTMTVSGTGFPASDLVLIQYAGTTVSTATTGTTGDFTKDVVVPSSADVGAKAKVKAESQVIEGVSDDADHKTPAPAMSPDTSATGQAGGAVTIGGINFKGFVRVTSIKLGGTEVIPVPAPLTDQWGAFTATDVRVPNLTLGTHPVEITVDEKTVTGFIQIVVEPPAPVLTDPADVFADLIADGSLTTVWHLNAAIQQTDPSGGWTSYSTNPDLAAFNTLSEIQGGQVYVLIMSAAGEFMGSPLYVGTNNVYIP